MSLRPSRKSSSMFSICVPAFRRWELHQAVNVCEDKAGRRTVRSGTGETTPHCELIHRIPLFGGRTHRVPPGWCCLSPSPTPRPEPTPPLCCCQTPGLRVCVLFCRINRETGTLPAHCDVCWEQKPPHGTGGSPAPFSFRRVARRRDTGDPWGDSPQESCHTLPSKQEEGCPGWQLPAKQAASPAHPRPRSWRWGLQ